VLGSKLSEVVSLWLNMLPLEKDVLEARSVNERLCKLVQENNPYILGDNYQNLPKILSLFSKAISSKFAKKETSEQMHLWLLNMKNTMPDLIQNAINFTPSDDRDRLIRLMSN